MGALKLDRIDGGASLDGEFPIRPIRLIRLIRPILPILPKIPSLTAINKKKTTKWSSEILLIQAEGTGFEPADTLRYRQFSKLLV